MTSRDVTHAVLESVLDAEVFAGPDLKPPENTPIENICDLTVAPGVRRADAIRRWSPHGENYFWDADVERN